MRASASQGNQHDFKIKRFSYLLITNVYHLNCACNISYVLSLSVVCRYFISFYVQIFLWVLSALRSYEQTPSVSEQKYFTFPSLNIQQIKNVLHNTQGKSIGNQMCILCINLTIPPHQQKLRSLTASGNTGRNGICASYILLFLWP